jgi:peptidoglycan/LPS O-acetylase OafA/YrhL
MLALDLMRGLAALVVLISHLRGDCFVEYGALPASQHNVLTTIFFAATRTAHEAVLIFFVLSGFVVGGDVLARVRERRFQIGDYSIDRSTRILIPLIPACLLTVVISFLLTNEIPPFDQIIANMVGLNEVITKNLAFNPVLWSLAYEIWFYILAGAAAYVVSQRPNGISVLVLLACVIVFTILKTHYLVIWMLGACASLFVKIRFKKSLLLAGVLLALAGSLLYQLGADSRSVVTIAYVPRIVAEFLFCIGIAMTFPFFASSSANQMLAPVSLPVTVLAAFSYTLYLTHRPTDAALGYIFGRADVISFQSLFAFGLRVLICLIVAGCFYLCFERNTSGARKYLRNRISNWSAVKDSVLIRCGIKKPCRMKL